MTKTFDEKWKKLMEAGKEREPVVRGDPSHKMPPQLVADLVSVARFRAFTPDQPNDSDENLKSAQQLSWDLRIPKFRLFDEIGMARGGRLEGTDEAKETSVFVESLTDFYLECHDEGKIKKWDLKQFFNCFHDKLVARYD